MYVLSRDEQGILTTKVLPLLRQEAQEIQNKGWTLHQRLTVLCSEILCVAAESAAKSADDILAKI